MFGERLQGLLLILAGCATFALTYLAQQYLVPLGRVPVPPGSLPGLAPTASPLSCLLPLMGLGSAGLCFLGIKKLLAPDDWQPPKHLQ